jgi:hypothetical protein
MSGLFFVKRKFQMKNDSPATINPISPDYSEKLTARQASGTRYALRTECRFDCQLIRAVLHPSISSWKESSGYQDDDSYVAEDGVIWASQNWAADVDVQFIVKADGPSLNEIRWLMMTLTDCHVAAQSVERFELYTGERVDYDLLEASAQMPSPELIAGAIKGIQILCELNSNANGILQDAIEKLESAIL